MLLEVKEMSLSLKRRGISINILDGISFHLMKGETLGIVGESGCGKSMTALSLMKLLPDKAKLDGKIQFDNKNITTLSKKQMEKIRGNEISMIFQDPLTSLNPLHTVGKQIEESLLLHTNLKKNERKKRAIELLHEVGLPRPEELVREYPHQLSGGMRQRVMIAISMACHPNLLICDEPTTALDVTVQAQILELMNKFKKEKDMAMIMITHDLGVVAEVCDRVMVMYAGRVVEQANVANLFANPSHPYTKALLESIPKVGAKKEKLGSIPGTVPAPENLPIGCRFVDRCPEAMEVCYQKQPKMYKVASEHQSACWLHEDKEEGKLNVAVGSEKS